MSKELKPANQHPDFGKVCSHGQLKRKCYTCELEEEIARLEEKNRKMREGLNKCLDHWAIVAGPSAYERSTMRILLENALGGES